MATAVQATGEVSQLPLAYGRLDLLQKLYGASGHGCSAVRMVPGHQLLTAPVSHQRPGLLAHEQSPQVVPWSQARRRAVHVGVRYPVCHGAQIESSGTESPVLAPSEMATWEP